MWTNGVYDEIKKIMKTKEKEYVVFDCDNTLIMNDLNQALDYYIILHDYMKSTKEDYYNFFINSDFPYDIKKKAKEIYEIYEISKTQENYLESSLYKDFVVKFIKLLNEIFKNYDSDIYTYLYVNLTAEEYENLVYKSFFYMTNKKHEYKKTISSNNEEIYSYLGLTLVDEMKELIKEFDRNNIDVYIISGSIGTIVKKYFYEFVPEYYNEVLPIKGIYGVQLEEKDGKYTGKLKKDSILTIREGKVVMIDYLLYKKYNKGPLFVAGDSEGDYYMMTHYKNTKKVLIIDRNRNCKIQELINSKDEKYLIQYVDEKKVEFIESGPSVTFK